MNSKEICLKLIAAESEADVQAVMKSVPEMREPENWQPLDRRETNFNVMCNQASDGGKALTELMTNMVDAVLTRHALEMGIDPKGKDAPKTMYEAVDKLVRNLHGGKLINTEARDTWLQDFAKKNLVIGITGAKSKAEGRPCYTFVDNGEGQCGEDFEDTFLSLSAGHKKSIPFVQGQFNMGSSGVLGYCGRHWFKLIVSRRYDGKSGWAWTIMRRRPGGDDSLPIAEYFILDRKEIPTFQDDCLYPFQTKAGKRYDGVMLRTGTVVKLFDYQVGAKYLSFKGAREALNENLVETILPFRLFDFRQVPSTKESKEKAQARGADRAAGIDTRPFYGMEFLLIRSHREAGLEDVEDDAVGEESISVGEHEEPKFGKISISAIPLKQKIPSWLRNSNRIFHAVNGQVQFKQARGFLTTCKLPALKDRVVIIVDASGLTFYAHTEVWKGDREHIRQTITGERYHELVRDIIQNSEALKELQRKVAEQELKQSSSRESNELFQKLVDSDATLADLLSHQDPKIKISASDDDEGGDQAGPGSWDDGKYSPTFIELQEKYKGKELGIKLNAKRLVSARTDAQNGYLRRPENTGQVCISEEVRSKFGIRTHLKDGVLNIQFFPHEGVATPGEKFTFTIGLHDNAMPNPVVSDETITLVVEDEGAPREKNGDDDHDKPERGGKKPQKEKTPSMGLPKCVLLRKPGNKTDDIDGYEVREWPDEFNEYDGGKIKDLGDGQFLYEINYDNVYHLKYRRKQPSKVAKRVLTTKYILGMRILMLGFEHARRILAGKDEGASQHEDEFRRMAARGAAATVLALAEAIPNIVDKSKVSEDDDVE